MAELFVGPDEDPGRYRVERPVGRGGEGTVFRCVEVSSGATVAIKLLASDHDERRAALADRWRKQCRILAEVSWPGVVSLRECFDGVLPHRQGQPGERGLFLVMDWVDGPNLEAVVRGDHRDAQGINRVLDELMPVASALDHLHSGRQTGGVAVVHGDVKPANLILTRTDGGVLVDLGMLTKLDDSGGEACGGTRGYLAPEVEQGGIATPAADRFAFAGLVHFVLTGHHPPYPFDAEVLRDNVLAVPALQGREDLVERLVGGMSPEPSQRPTNLATWLPSFVLRQRPKQRRWRLAVAAVPAVILLALGSNRLLNESTPPNPCSAVKIVSPRAEDVVPAGAVRVVWEPAACEPMVFQWYQYDRPEPGADVHDAQSGDSIRLQGPSTPGERTVRTELKIWVPGAATPAHSIFIRVAPSEA